MEPMAAVIESQHLKQAALPGRYVAGAALHRAGAVSDVEPGYGGTCGVVTVTDGTAYEVWIGVRHRLLVAECDCPDAEPEAATDQRLASVARDRAAAPQLCAHGVALGLAALDRQLSWAPAPRTDAETVDPSAALNSLTPSEKARVLDALLDSNPELLERVYKLAVQALDLPGSARHARGHSSGGELRENTAAAVRQALLGLDIDDMRTGYRPGHGYTDECEAARRLVDAALEPFLADLTRRLGLGLTSAAHALASGILDGLRACEGSYDGDQVLCYAGEDLEEDYGYGVRDRLRTAGVPLPSGD